MFHLIFFNVIVLFYKYETWQDEVSFHSKTIDKQIVILVERDFYGCTLVIYFYEPYLPSTQAHPRA